MRDKPIEEYKQKLELKPLASELPKAFKKVCCPSCNEDVPADNLELKDKIAKCSTCDIIFPIHEEVASLIEKNSTTNEMARPEGIDIYHFEEEMDITLNQPFTPIEWLGITILPLGSLISGLLYFDKGKGDLWIFAAFCLLSIWLIITFIFRSKHKVHISIDDDFIEVKYRPKKLVSDKKYEVDEIEQLYVKVVTGYDVYMIVNGPDGQKHVPLLAGLGTLSKAKYLEQEIEKKLGLPNKPVAEELK